MPLFVLTCDKCGFVRKALGLTTEVADAGVPCKKGCGGTARRTPEMPSLHNKEVLRFSHQVKDVERFSDAAQLYDERAHQDDRKPR
jgi:hypothetical protein